MGESNASEGGSQFLELLRDGLTYDVHGLAPGPAVATPAFRHRFGIDEGVIWPKAGAITVSPGPHLAAGARSMPVIRTLASIVVSLSREFEGLLAVGWKPAMSLIGIEFFRSTVSAWLDGGAFPALGLTALLQAPDGGMHSEGLAFFTGQELRLEPELADDRTQASQLAIRLINQLVLHGRVDREQRLTGPDGHPLVLTPSANRRFVRVRRG